jgi:hypothetical protein
LSEIGEAWQEVSYVVQSTAELNRGQHNGQSPSMKTGHRSVF